jgi:hypothetical protein
MRRSFSFRGRARAHLADRRVAPHLRAAHAPHRREVADVVRDVLDLQVVEDQTQAHEIAVRLLDELLLEDHLLLVDLFRRQLGDDAAEVGLERVLRDEHDLLLRVAEEPFDGVVEERLLTGDLDVRDRGDVERHPTLGVGALDRQLDGHVRELHAVDHLE